MKTDKIDYFDGGTDSEFNEIGCRDEKMKLLTNFLLKTDFEFKIERFDRGKAIVINEVQFLFFDSGGICLEVNNIDLKEEKE